MNNSTLFKNTETTQSDNDLPKTPLKTKVALFTLRAGVKLSNLIIDHPKTTAAAVSIGMMAAGTVITYIGTSALERNGYSDENPIKKGDKGYVASSVACVTSLGLISFSTLAYDLIERKLSIAKHMRDEVKNASK